MKKILGTAVLLAIATPALADESRSPFYREGWYVMPMGVYMKPDKSRCSVDPGLGAGVLLGNRGEVASLEVWGQFLSLSHGECTYLVPGPPTPAPNDDERVPRTESAGDVKLNGGGLDVVLGPYGDMPVVRNMFGLLGFGVIRRQGHPQYTSGASTMLGDAGLGYFYPFELFGKDVAARAEARYRYDVQQPPYPTSADQDPPPEHTFQDWIFNIGLQVMLGSREEPAPQAEAKPEPVAVVATADADNDGVPDDQDKCPDTAIGTQVDAGGCVPPPPVPAAATIETAKAGDTIILHGVNFETAKATLTTNAKTILDDVAAKLVARPDLNIEIGGHTDSRGSDSYNQSLSEQRAQSVVEYLAGKGVDGSHMSARGYGEGQPIDTNDTDEGREKNRRVELKVLEAGTSGATASGSAQAPAAATNAEPAAAPAEATAAEPAPAPAESTTAQPAPSQTNNSAADLAGTSGKPKR